MLSERYRPDESLRMARSQKLVPLSAGVDPDIYRAFGTRWVGSAMAACPKDVPWQRT